MREISEFLAAKYSHYVYLLVANCVRLLFGAELVVYSGVFRVEVFFSWKQLPAVVENNPMREVRGNQNSIFYFTQRNNELKLIIKLCKVKKSWKFGNFNFMMKSNSFDIATLFSHLMINYKD